MREKDVTQRLRTGKPVEEELDEAFLEGLLEGEGEHVTGIREEDEHVTGIREEGEHVTGIREEGEHVTESEELDEDFLNELLEGKAEEPPAIQSSASVASVSTDTKSLFTKEEVVSIAAHCRISGGSNM